MVRARLAGLGLVLTLGFLMLVSLVISAGLAALGHWIDALFPAAQVLMMVVNFAITVALLSIVFAAIFKLLRHLDCLGRCRDRGGRDWAAVYNR